MEGVSVDSRGLPQDKQSEAGAFIDTVRTKVKQLQIEPEMKLASLLPALPQYS